MKAIINLKDIRIVTFNKVDGKNIIHIEYENGGQKDLFTYSDISAELIVKEITEKLILNEHHNNTKFILLNL